MIRYNYINRLVLQIYFSMDKIIFPINPIEIINKLPNCRYLSYQKFAEINGCTIDEVIEICKSKSGCTNFDVDTGRYLILCNESTENHNNPGRQRWTCLHEIGHVVCDHLNVSALEMLAENAISDAENKEYELEADYFAATAIAPFPLFKEFGITSMPAVQSLFGLSAEAASYRFNQYLKWKQDHRKTAWENDMLQVYRKKNSLPLYSSP